MISKFSAKLVKFALNFFPKFSQSFIYIKKNNKICQGKKNLIGGYSITCVSFGFDTSVVPLPFWHKLLLLLFLPNF
jgi:hypothetical protein